MVQAAGRHAAGGAAHLPAAQELHQDVAAVALEQQLGDKVEVGHQRRLRGREAGGHTGVSIHGIGALPPQAVACLTGTHATARLCRPEVRAPRQAGRRAVERREGAQGRLAPAAAACLQDDGHVGGVEELDGVGLLVARVAAAHAL